MYAVKGVTYFLGEDDFHNSCWFPKYMILLVSQIYDSPFNQ